MTLTDQGPSSDPSPEALEQLRECECAQFQRHFQSHFFHDLKSKENTEENSRAESDVEKRPC